MPHVQGNCHWCGRSYDEVALDALAAYTAATEYPGKTVRDRNIRSRAYLEGSKRHSFASRMLACRSLEIALGPRCSDDGDCLTHLQKTHSETHYFIRRISRKFTYNFWTPAMLKLIYCYYYWYLLDDADLNINHCTLQVIVIIET